jgi:hypothetical protein
MPYSWFRFYHEFASDPKIQMLSEKDQRRFVMVLCLRCCNGAVTLQDNQIAFQLRISIDEWLESKKLLIQLNLVDELNRPVNWDKRQLKSDHSRQRVEKHRNRYSNVLDQTRPDQTRPDSDTEPDQEPEKKKVNGFLHANGKVNGLGFIPSIETADKLLSVAPGWDHHFLINAYNSWRKGKERARNDQAAFLGWAKSFTKGRAPQ